jgi:hypothetical protein
MSGPKVVRIVTREELEAICRRHLANVWEAANDLKRCAKRYELLDDRLKADIDGRCAALERLFAEARFGELQKQASLVIGFFANEVDGIRARAVAAAEAARSKRRRIAAAATTLISAMESSGSSPPAALRDIVARASFAGDQDLAAMQSVLNQNYSSLAAVPERSAPSEASKQLAKRLGDDEAPRTYSEWLAAQNSATDERDARLDSLMAEIDAFEEPQVARPFLERAAAIKTEAAANRRALLTDSLVLDLSEHSRQRRSDASLGKRLRALRANLSTLGVPNARALELEITSMLESSVFKDAEVIIARGTALVDSEMAILAAAARRRAVLEALAQLGYEVRDTMTTAWARDGRLVVRKPGATDYGVELGAPPDISRLQIRLVGSDQPSATRNFERDRDMETIWCSDFDRLRDLLGRHGGEMVIESALKAGAQPLETVTFDQAAVAASTAAGRQTTQQR